MVFIYMILHTESNKSKLPVSSPLVSIIVPTYNQNLDYLRTCIQSALNQTYENIEVIVSDNHSTNGAAELLNAIKDVRLKLVKPEQFLSMVKNFSFAASCASGKYLSFLSSDDFLMLDAIDKLVPLLESDDSAVFAFGNIYADLDYNKNKINTQKFVRPLTFKKNKLSISDSLKLFVPWKLSSTWFAGDLIRRETYNTLGGFESCYYKINGDVWITAQLLRLGSCKYTDDMVAFIRLRENGCNPADGDRSGRNILDSVYSVKDFINLFKCHNVPFFSKMRIYIICYLFPHRMVYYSLDYKVKYNENYSDKIDGIQCIIDKENIYYGFIFRFIMSLNAHIAMFFYRSLYFISKISREYFSRN